MVEPALDLAVEVDRETTRFSRSNVFWSILVPLWLNTDELAFSVVSAGVVPPQP